MAILKSISGIRGTIGGVKNDGLTPFEILRYASAYAMWLKRYQQNAKVVIGRDARISGQMVNKIVSGALMGCGIDVVDLGLSTTPTVEMAVKDLNAQGGIILTASHNPKQWNALKMLNSEGEFISAQIGAEILEIAETIEDLAYPEVDDLGSYTFENYKEKHFNHIKKLDLVDAEAIASANFRVVVDGINSSGSVYVPELLNALGVDQVIVINEETNGKFAHNPEPLPENLSELANTVIREKAHLGIAVDPDVDRLAFVSEDGEMFGEEYTLVAIADYILAHTKGAAVSNLSSTMALKDICEKHKCSYYPSAVGEVNVVEKMKEVDAVIGGEGNGGVIYPALHYGRDALVGIALFLTQLAKLDSSVSSLRASYPNYEIVKDKMPLQKEVNVDEVLQKLEKKYSKHEINTVDGLKITMPEGWVMIRKSNTEPIVRVYAESSSRNIAENIVRQIKSDITTFSA